MLAMVVASDEAVTTLRSTSGLIEAVVECSSFARSQRIKRKFLRKPLGFIKRVLPGGKLRQQKNSWVEPGLTGQVQQNANKLLAALGHNGTCFDVHRLSMFFSFFDIALPLY